MPDQTTLNSDALETAATKVYPHHWNGDLESKLAQLPQFTQAQATESASRIRAEKLDEMRDHVSAYLAVAQPVVKSVAELDALPVGSLVRTASGREYYKSPQIEYPWSQGRDHDRSSSRHLNHYGPVTVVHRPEAIN